MFDAKSSTAAQIELLRSRLVVDDTVKRMHLDIGAYPRTLPFVGGIVGSALNTFNIQTPAFLSHYAWGNEKIDVSVFDVPKDMLEKKFTLIVGENGTYALNDPDGMSILTGKVGQEVSGQTPLGPVKLKVDQLVGNPGAYFDLQRFSTLSTIDKPAKAFDGRGNGAAVGHRQHRP